MRAMRVPIPSRPVRAHRSLMAPQTTQTPRPAPIGPRAERPVCRVKTRAMLAVARIRPVRSGTSSRVPLARFHGSCEPIGSSRARATMNGVNAALKKGTPTDSFRLKNNSATSGQIVPIKTTKHDTASSRLLATRADSRLRVEKTPFASILLARKANRVSAPPMKTPRIIRMKTPRSGSFAKACTEVRTPERTMKVPISENPKARMARRIVHAFRASRFSTTMAECSSAAEMSHGMNDAFSTGSQNQKPPQPSS